MMKPTIKIIFFLFVICSCDRTKDKVPADFNFKYSVDLTETINTFDSTYTRSYNFHDTTIKLTLTADEMYKIYSIMVENNVLELPQKFESAENATCIMPATSEYLTVTMNGKTNKIEYDDSYKPKKNQDQADKFVRITSIVNNIMTSKKEVRQLPESDRIKL